MNRFDPVAASAFLGYHDAVIEMAVGYLRLAPDTDLGRVTVRPTLRASVTVQRRLVGVLNEGFQHLGQIHICLSATDQLPKHHSAT